MLRAHLYLWKMNVFLNIMDSISGTTRALFSTIGEREVQGGSTITQQTVKIINNERSFTRKLKELFVAHKVEQQYSKNQILSFI